MSKFPRRGPKTFSCRCAAQTFLGLNCDPVIFGAGSAPDRGSTANYPGLGILLAVFFVWAFTTADSGVIYLLSPEEIRH